MQQEIDAKATALQHAEVILSEARKKMVEADLAEQAEYHLRKVQVQVEALRPLEARLDGKIERANTAVARAFIRAGLLCVLCFATIAMGQTTCFVTGNTTTCSTPVSNGITTIGHETTTCNRYGNNITCNAGNWRDEWNQQAAQNAASAGAGIVNIIGAVIEHHQKIKAAKPNAQPWWVAVSKLEADTFVQNHPEYADTMKNALLMKSIWMASGITYPTLTQYEQCYKQLRAANLIELVPAPKGAR